ncbi:glycoside hydrolase family 2 protein [Ramlibacter sp. MMS24-I3-19]|uniref:glycoside hydrolase family 2 protein n=1 Tax=Ramlibacter sp. MMS24-I3-19 TaxID=3416606 RepID=UPI003D0279E7
MGLAGSAPQARQPLAARWRLCAGEPDRDGAPPCSDRGWTPISHPQTVAAALRERGDWSLDAPARDFDAHDWWFSAHFDAPPEQADQLSFDGLATLAEVSLNGEPLLASDNMFLAHRVPVADRLRLAGNELVLRFRSVQSALARRRPRPRWRTPMVAHQQLRWLRTTLLGRTPGWSPPAAHVGPWRDIAWSTREPWHGHVQASVVDGRGRCQLRLEADPDWVRSVESAQLVLVGPDGREHVQALSSSTVGFEATLQIAQPALWWPHTHGQPTLYRAALRLQTRDGNRHEAALGSVGFRTVEIDTSGDGFALRVNGERVFCRGAGWLPLDPVSLRSTPDACLAALQQVRACGMNMLRLAGTGVMEEEHFYATCDALGLLVWQDFLFASMDYPFADAAFADGAAREVRHQLAQLAPHPCVAVLCGNSEVEQQAAMWGVPREQWHAPFFHQTLPALCRELAPGVPYWPSSAHGGAFPHQASTGTTSYYGVGAYERGLDDARRSGLRFASECLAFANVPEPSALERMPGGLATRVHHPQWKARSPRDLGAGWDFDDTRDHYVRELFGVDPARLRHADHDRYLALGRMAIAETMRSAFSEWRRAGSACNGALLLQLRDLWAGAGWGVVDDAGVPKSGWHALRRVLQPIAVVVTDEGGDGLVAHAINDTAGSLQVQLAFTAWRDGDVRVAEGARPLELPPRSTVAVPLVGLLDHFMDLNHAWRFGPAACELVQVRLLDAHGGVLAQAFHFPLGLAPLAASPQRDLGLQLHAAGNGDGGELTIATRRCAIGVHLDVPGWTTDDNHFHLAPGSTHHVRLQRARDGAPLAGSLQALNLSGSLPIEITP